jgi:hypothetical protein
LVFFKTKQSTKKILTNFLKKKNAKKEEKNPFYALKKINLKKLLGLGLKIN